jgi:hypothetical protein
MASNIDMGGVLKGAYSESDRSLRTVNTGSLVKFDFDYYDVAYPTTTQEVYTYKVGGGSGTTVGTVTINYTDATKQHVTNASVVVP